MNNKKVQATKQDICSFQQKKKYWPLLISKKKKAPQAFKHGISFSLPHDLNKYVNKIFYLPGVEPE